MYLKVSKTKIINLILKDLRIENLSAPLKFCDFDIVAWVVSQGEWNVSQTREK